MKKMLLTLLVICAAISLSQAQIVITEIMYNPPESGTDSLEYIELYNVSNASVNMEGWSMFGVEYVFPAFTLAPGKYVVLSKNAAALQSVLGVSTTQWTNGALTNSPGETIKVLNAAGATIDEVTYVNAAPWP
ncbi:MAG: lamin tail domain-containing protein, partial [Bacteroidota bacterium]